MFPQRMPRRESTPTVILQAIPGYAECPLSIRVCSFHSHTIAYCNPVSLPVVDAHKRSSCAWCSPFFPSCRYRSEAAANRIAPIRLLRCSARYRAASFCLDASRREQYLGCCIVIVFPPTRSHPLRDSPILKRFLKMSNVDVEQACSRAGRTVPRQV